MGVGTDVSSTLLGNALNGDEMRGRSEEERSFSSPEATPDGQVTERLQPQAAPVTVSTERWD